ncbi:sensor histidine kinase [Streptomyces scabiei]|uniref:sensor histidine kinase n=1 Tax=Streptomyces scabiei TaxID=1930 RepID=UPI0029B6EA1E|nr:sensor histidine kinase [Streptomyces scabiei]MDX3117579.1 sensor histidine kinase [Streptomyces scabiei]
MTRSFEDWRRSQACRRAAWRSAFREARKQQRQWKADKADKERLKDRYRAVHEAGEAGSDSGSGRPAPWVPDDAGPPASGFTLMPWLLMGMGAISNLFHGETPNPWIGGIGLLTFNSLYIYVSFRSFRKETRHATSTRAALALMGLVTCALALAYGGSWLLFFPLLGLATGAALRGPHLRAVGTAVAVVAGTVSGVHEGWEGLTIAYATWISTMVTAAILSLSEAVRELRAAREELARRAVEEERLRFSRDLHDLLGHTLSVIVVKSEAARRLAPRDMDAALAQVTDIEAVGRQALTEIREAVTGYREGSLGSELDRARSALTAAGVEPSVTRSGPPPDPQSAALLGWVVREAVTNVVRHSGATRCLITVAAAPERIRLTVTDDGHGRQGADGDAPCAPGGGTGLTGLRERLAIAGGSLTAGPGPNGGFTVAAELPLESPVASLSEPQIESQVQPQAEQQAREKAREKVQELDGDRDRDRGGNRGATTSSAAAGSVGSVGTVPSVDVGPNLGP